jgi:PPOX class probable F420-dependent enzyme
MSVETPFANLAGAEFMVLTTYKRSGDAVPTTVWFAQQGERLYVTTVAQAGKSKRIRANPCVTVAPSDQVGNLSGAVAGGQARILSPDESGVAEAALRVKYGEQYVVLTGRMSPDVTRIFIEVVPA